MTNPIASDDAFENAPIIRPYVSKPDREGRLIRGVARVPSTVDVRLVGQRRDDVLLVARILAEVFTVSDMSRFLSADDGRIRLDLTILSPATPSGGSR